MKIAIVTSEDFALAGDVFLRLRACDDNNEYVFINVQKSKKKPFSFKELKLVLLFGILATLQLVWGGKKNRRNIVALGGSAYQRINKVEVDGGHLRGKYDRIILVNYPWLFKSELYQNTWNCHPSYLPRFRGLMPICHGLMHSFKSTKQLESGATIHVINEEFDQGFVVWQKGFCFDKNTPISEIYKDTYGSFVEGIIASNKSIEAPHQTITGGEYFSTMGWSEVVSLKRFLLFHNPFVRFMINGGVIGLISWLLQIVFYNLLTYAGYFAEVKMAVSVWMAFVIVLLLNFLSLKRVVFGKDGYLGRFVLATTFMIWLVGGVSQVIYDFLVISGLSFADVIAYPLSALTIAPLSYLVKKKIVFTKPSPDANQN